MNRYGNFINNPMNATDPSGYTFSHDQLDDAHQSGGIWVNTEYIQSFYNIQRDFDVGYEAMPGIYEYNYSTGDYTNSMGHRVSYQEVFNNYVVPNATFLPTNTNLSSIEFGTRNGESGVWFSTITWGPIKRMDSEDFIVSTEAQILSSFLSFASVGGGDGSAGGRGQISIDESHNRIGFVPLDVGSNYGAFQMANYRSNISIRGNQNNIFVGVTNSNTAVSGGQVVFYAVASLEVDGSVIQKQVLVNGSVRFELPPVPNVLLTVTGGWEVYFNSGGVSVPVYHPIFWPFSLNFKDDFKLK